MQSLSFSALYGSLDLFDLELRLENQQSMFIAESIIQTDAKERWVFRKVYEFLCIRLISILYSLCTITVIYKSK